MNAPGPTTVADVVAAERPALVGLAYRLLGSAAEAEDVVQEACLKLEQHGLAGIDRPGAWLNRVTSRLCLDRLRSAQTRRETYIGPWLPEPWALDGADDPAHEAEIADSLSMAFLLVLENLSPAERVAFVLHDVFGHGYDDLAALLDRSEAACRQLVSRARSAVHARTPRYEATAAAHDRAVQVFLDAARGGAIAPLIDVLAPDVVLTSDGGGVVSAARRPVHGADRVARFLAGLVGQAPPDLEVTLVPANGGAGVLTRTAAGEPIVLFVLGLHDARIGAVYAIRNPEKLRQYDTRPGRP